MMENISLYIIDYYEKSVFKGSYNGLCFRIGKKPMEDEESEKRLLAQAWKGPFILEKTTETIYSEEFEFSQDGLDAANEWISNLEIV